MTLLMISGDRSVASGKESAFFRTLQGLSSSFERIDVLCPRVRGQAVTQLFGNVFLHPARSGKLLFPLWVRIAGTALVKAHAHNVLTVHDYPPFLNGLAARLLLRKIKISSALEIHHLIGMPKAASITEWIGRWMTRVLIKHHASHFTTVRTVNASVKEQLVAWGLDASRIKIVSSVYIDTALIQSIEDSEKKYDFIFSARLVANKGLLSVLSALQRVPNATLLIIGDGSLLSKAKKYAGKIGVDVRVTFAGWLPTARDVLTSMKSGSVFIMHSTSEGNPRVAIEAMALGLPVVTTRVGIMPDVIEDGRNGLFVSGQTDDLVRAMQELVGAEERIHRMGLSAMEDVRRFNAEETLAEYSDFLHSLAS